MNHRIIPVTAFSQNCSLIWREQTRLAALVDPAAMRKIKQEVDASGLDTDADPADSWLFIWTTLAQRRNCAQHYGRAGFGPEKKKMSSGCKACLRKVVCLV